VLDPRHVELAQRLRTSGSLTAVAVTLLLSLVLCSAASSGQLALETLRGLALCNAATYALMHLWRRVHRARLARRSDDPARIASLVYRSPARITDLDLAAYWGAFAVIAPVLLAWLTFMDPL
jgi:hypothetical protein